MEVAWLRLHARSITEVVKHVCNVGSVLIYELISACVR